QSSASGIGSSPGASRVPGTRSQRSSCRPEGLPRWASKRETSPSSRTSRTPKTAEKRSISERGRLRAGAVDYLCFRRATRSKCLASEQRERVDGRGSRLVERWEKAALFTAPLRKTSPIEPCLGVQKGDRRLGLASHCSFRSLNAEWCCGNCGRCGR